MELKYYNYYDEYIMTLVLIVPLWNWNDRVQTLSGFFCCFNRTFMELKLTFASGTGTHPFVLIVPLWNWNPTHEAAMFLKTCFNRTFMELKLLTENLPRAVPTVLIVPLWNWNIVKNVNNSGNFLVLIVPLNPWNTGFLNAKRMPMRFNRTFMELKCRIRLSRRRSRGF